MCRYCFSLNLKYGIVISNFKNRGIGYHSSVINGFKGGGGGGGGTMGIFL